MTREIEQNLGVQAQAIQSDLDQMLFERFENAVVWRRSELMEDLRLGDVDKRVASYLVGLQNGYGDVYSSLDCVDVNGAVLASSVATRIGTTPPLEDAALISIATELSGDAVTLSLPRSSVLDGRAPLSITAAIPSTYAASGVARAKLRMALSLSPINRLLDAAAQDRRVIVIVDRQGRWVASSGRLRGQPLPDANALARSRTIARSEAAGILGQSPWLSEPALMGRSTSTAMPGFGGSGWTTMIFEPVDEALAPVSRMAVVFATLFSIVLVATLVIASWIASAMSRPIADLTERTRRYQMGMPVLDRPIQTSAIAEVQVLANAYEAMITSLENSRLELVRASKMAMLGELGAVLAHEVRTPLGILRSSAQVLMRNPALDSEGLELMHFIESETVRLNRLVSTLLETARPPQLMPETFELHDLITKCVQMHELQAVGGPSAHPLVKIELDASSPRMFADAEQLMQVFFNLLNNACEAAGELGYVAVSTGDCSLGVCVEFEDSGPGVPPELESAIFEPFISRRTGGFGLGLAVVRQVVSAHGGTIHVGMSRWAGARFTIRLPHGKPALRTPQ